MSVNHQKRIEGIVNEAIKKVALNQPYGYVVSFTFAPPVDETGTPQLGKPLVPSWWVFVSAPNPLVGQSDLGNGFAINGVLPPDDAFRFVAAGLFQKTRQDLDRQSKIPTVFTTPEQATASLQAQREAAQNARR